MAEDTNNEAGAPGATPATPPKTTPPATTAAIAARLSQSPVETAAALDGGPKAAEPAPAINLNALTPAQLQQLKAMLNATPDSVANQRKNPVVSLRNYRGFDQKGKEFGGIIVDQQNAYNTLVHNKETNITSEILMMKVRFVGADDWTVIPWREFMDADQVKCEVVSSRQEKGQIKEGEPILSKETGQLVERIITTVQDFFTVKLPEGSNPATVEIPGRIANA